VDIFISNYIHDLATMAFAVVAMDTKVPSKVQ